MCIVNLKRHPRCSLVLLQLAVKHLPSVSPYGLLLCFRVGVCVRCACVCVRVWKRGWALFTSKHIRGKHAYGKTFFGVVSPRFPGRVLYAHRRLEETHTDLRKHTPALELWVS